MGIINLIILFLKKERLYNCVHKHISLHGNYDHMGEAINLVNNFSVKTVIMNSGHNNDL